MGMKTVETVIYNEPDFTMVSIDRFSETTIGECISLFFLHLFVICPISLGIIRVLGGSERFWKMWNLWTDDLVGFFLGIFWIPIEAMMRVLGAPLMLLF